ncbi:MAG: outer membrane lipoprotein carrier protein LolA [Desulfuromonadaceae bacterium]|nr:outer membrane lipoprotein carrier protein LolA [Desulfuromonadaceae bacterium]
MQEDLLIKRFHVILLLLSFILLNSSLCQAGTISPVEGLEALRRGFGGISDFTADITQEKRLILMKRTMVMSGTLRFKKPDLFFMEINPPFSGRMLLRDNVIEQASGRDRTPGRIALPPEQGLKQWFSRLASPVTSLPDGVAIQADLTDSVYTLTIAPAGKGQVKDITIVFLGDGTVRRLVINERNGDRATMSLKKVRRNVGLTERDFRLE